MRNRLVPAVMGLTLVGVVAAGCSSSASRGGSPANATNITTRHQAEHVTQSHAAKTLPAGTTATAIANKLGCTCITTPAEDPPAGDDTTSADCQLAGAGELEIYGWRTLLDQSQFRQAIVQTQDVGGDVDTFIVEGPRWDVTINEQLSPSAAQGACKAMQFNVGGKVVHIVSS